MKINFFISCFLIIINKIIEFKKIQIFFSLFILRKIKKKNKKFFFGSCDSIRKRVL
jgi:hypothetical protein